MEKRKAEVIRICLSKETARKRSIPISRHLAGDLLYVALVREHI